MRETPGAEGQTTGHRKTWSESLGLRKPHFLGVSMGPVIHVSSPAGGSRDSVPSSGRSNHIMYRKVSYKV